MHILCVLVTGRGTVTLPGQLARVLQSMAANLIPAA